MYIKKIEGPRAVTLPDGTVMTRADLPPAGTTRWVASRKVAVVRAVAAGLLTRGEAIKTYGLSEEEFAIWWSNAAKHGVKGLQVTKIQDFRQP